MVTSSTEHGVGNVDDWSSKGDVRKRSSGRRLSLGNIGPQQIGQHRNNLTLCVREVVPGMASLSHPVRCDLLFDERRLEQRLQDCLQGAEARSRRLLELWRGSVFDFGRRDVLSFWKIFIVSTLFSTISVS